MPTAAANLAEYTADAFMADDYGPTEWQACAQLLLNFGLTTFETEAFLRSKHMRWASDFTGTATAEGLRRYIAGAWFPARSIKAECQALLAEAANHLPKIS